MNHERDREMAETIKINIYRNKSIDELTKLLADPDDRADIGSASASGAAVSAALLAKAADSIHRRMADHEDEKLEWYVRNTEILRTYMVKLIDEDVKCRAPLFRAIKEGEERRIEAARQTSVSICLEIINMMGKCLEISEGLLAYADSSESADIEAGADLAYGASLAAGRFVLNMSKLSTDETYRFVMKRENEITMKEQKETYDRILNRTL